jgi:hypothetical protein
VPASLPLTPSPRHTQRRRRACRLGRPRRREAGPTRQGRRPGREAQAHARRHVARAYHARFTPTDATGALNVDLEARERDLATRSNEEEVARARLRNEIARLRRAAAERAARGGAAASPFDDDGAAGGGAGAAPAPAAHDAAAAAAQQAHLQRTLKLVWNRGDGDYTAARLRQVRAPRQLSALALHVG